MVSDQDLVDRLNAALTDRYRIEREIGAGGMATVYLAEDLRHNRKVAVKVLKPELAAVVGTERFLREIETAASLTHPHILPLFDSGEVDGFLFYVMPYVGGESLRARLEQEKQLPVEDALRISLEVADALSYAHSRGVIHRDIKPANILLEEGHAVVADFGIARAVDEAGGTNLTGTGVALGTPAYMSPEQAAGERELDGRSDLYSLACVLYEMLAGQPPFTGPTVESLIHQHLTAEPPNIIGCRPAVSGQVAAALERALSKTPADRFNPVALFGEALQPSRIAPLSHTAAAPKRRAPATPWGKRWALVAIAAVVVIVGAVALAWPFGGANGRTYPRTAIAVLPFENLSGDGPYAYFPGGLHDELLTQLAKVKALAVKGRTSVMAYADGGTAIRVIAEELQAGSIVEGSVQIVGDRLRVNVQLIDPETGNHLWAESYNRTLDDAFAVQSEIARQVVAALGAELSEGEARAIALEPTQDPEAYRLYLQGEEYRLRPGYERQNFEIAEQLFERAIARDSTFVLAYASLAEVHGLMHWMGFDPHPARLERAREAAEAAVRLAPDVPQARWALGRTCYLEGDYARALEDLTAVAEELPGSAELWMQVGFAHRRLGNWDETLAAFEMATALDPRAADLFRDLGGNTFVLLHRYPDAIEAYNRALELAPDLWVARLQKARVHLQWHGELDSFRSVLEQGPEVYGAEGGRDLWRARLALWEREPDTLLALLGAPETVTFEAREAYEPGLLYVAWAHQLRGGGDNATQAFAGALAQLDSALQGLPDDWRMHVSRGLALAGLGQVADARLEADWLTRSRVYRDAYDRSYLTEARAMIFAQAGLVEDALVELEPLLAGPSWTNAALVRLDPRYDPIRDDPRFQALLKRYMDEGEH